MTERETENTFPKGLRKRENTTEREEENLNMQHIDHWGPTKTQARKIS